MGSVTSSAIQDKRISVIILTYNEELNIAQALESVVGWADEVFVLDSFSTDKTLDIASGYKCQISQHAFGSFGAQSNYALDHLPIETEWVLFVDADEWLPDAIKHEISTLIATTPDENGFYVKWRLIWMGKWIKRGYYPSWILRLLRHGKVRCEDRPINPHLIVDGATGYLKNDFMHEDHKSIAAWISRHNNYSTMEAQELIRTTSAQGLQEIDARLFGTQAQRKRWLRYKIWNRIPPLLRPFFYFFYRLVLTGGFLDGRAAWVYHFLQALWYPMLIDLKYLELKQAEKRSGTK